MASATKPSQECILPVNAGPPYDYDSTALADTILRSSDFIHFYVFKAFLRFVSPFFKDMFALPCGADGNEKMNGFPVIPVEETSETLYLLLDFIYPHEDEPRIYSVPLFLSVCKATRKYCMNIIENRLRKRIIISHLMDTEPLRVYAVAVNFGWENVALIAARKASQMPLDKLSRIQELKNISGTDFYRFLEYKMRRDSLGWHIETVPVPLMTLPNLRAGFGAAASVPIPAQKPFDSAAKADIIFRSKDLIDFFILADLVRVASAPPSSLSDITIPLGKTIGETGDRRAIISVPEDSEVLRHLLGLIYYISDEVSIQNSRLFTQVVLAARRRGMDIIEARLRKQLTTSPLLHKEPLRVYIIASALGWDGLAKSAALNTLSEPLEDMTYMQDFDLVTGADLYRLVAFRFKCADAACDVINSDSDYKAYGPGKWYWDSSSSTFQHYGPTDQLFKKLRSCPRGSTIADAYKNEAEPRPGEGSPFAHRDQPEPQSTIMDTYERCAAKKRAKKGSWGACLVEDSPKSSDDYTVRDSSLMKILKCRQEIEDAVEAAVAKVRDSSPQCSTTNRRLLITLRSPWPSMIDCIMASENQCRSIHGYHTSTSMVVSAHIFVLYIPRVDTVESIDII